MNLSDLMQGGSLECSLGTLLDVVQEEIRIRGKDTQVEFSTSEAANISPEFKTASHRYGKYICNLLPLNITREVVQKICKGQKRIPLVSLDGAAKGLKFRWSSPDVIGEVWIEAGAEAIVYEEASIRWLKPEFRDLSKNLKLALTFLTDEAGILVDIRNAFFTDKPLQPERT